MPTKKKASGTKKKATTKKKSVVSRIKNTLKKVVSPKKKAATKKATKTAVKKTTKKATTKKSTTKKSAVKKTTKKATTKKTTAKKTTTKKAVTKKTTVKKSATHHTKKKGSDNKVATTKPNATQEKKKIVVKKVATKTTTTPKSKAKTISYSSDTTFMGIPAYKESKNEEYMNDKQREHIKSILLAWRQALMEEVDRTVTHMKDEAANFPDPSDRASQEEEFSLELRTRDRERKLIKKIEDSLENLSDDDFGYCETCGIEIGIRRLEARPTATLCIDCKTLAEIKERQNSGG